MFKPILKRLSRFYVRKSRFLLPRSQRDDAEKRLRGRIEKNRLAEANCVVVSPGNSGRTWLRVMLDGFDQATQNRDTESAVDFDEPSRADPSIPKILFTHDSFLRFYTENPDSKADYYDKRVVLLVRHPADVAVSRYFQWKHRAKPRKVRLLGLPDQREDLSLFDFVMDSSIGLEHILDFMRRWDREIPRCKDLIVLRYEDLRQDPSAELEKFLDFMGASRLPEQIDAAVEYGSFENMKKREAETGSSTGGVRVRPGDRDNKDSYKVRRGKVGGYRDYFDDAELDKIETLIAKDLPDRFGYAQQTVKDMPRK
ncbi:MAG: sulfotransferase domain-containing protein [Myxococcota bacterium]